MSTPATQLKHTQHAVSSWHTLMRRYFVEAPEMIRQSQAHRAELNALIRRHGGK